MPGTRRIYTGVSRSPGSARALRQTAQLAHHDALLIPVLAWLPPDSRRLPRPELRQIWHDDARQRPLPTGPSRVADERTHRLSAPGGSPSQQGGKWS